MRYLRGVRERNGEGLAMSVLILLGLSRATYSKAYRIRSLTRHASDLKMSRTAAVSLSIHIRYNHSSLSAWLFEYTGGGACADTKSSCFPMSHREACFTVAALHQYSVHETPDVEARCVTTAEDWINEVIHPLSPGGPLPCVSAAMF